MPQVGKTVSSFFSLYFGFCLFVAPFKRKHVPFIVEQKYWGRVNASLNSSWLEASDWNWIRLNLHFQHISWIVSMIDCQSILNFMAFSKYRIKNRAEQSKNFQESCHVLMHQSLIISKSSIGSSEVWVDSHSGS